MFVLASTETGGTARKINSYVSFDYIQNYPYFSILKIIVLVMFSILFLLFILRKWHPHIFAKALPSIKIALIAIVFFDLIYFSKDVLSARIHNISNYKTASIPKELENKRVILNSTPIVGTESLLYKNWSPFGNSQLKEKNYVNYYAKLGIKLRGVPASNDALPPNYQNLKKAGVASIVNTDRIIYLNDNNNELDLIKNNIAGHYLKKEEGHMIMQINNSSDEIINTYLKYDKNWQVKIDGRKIKITKNEIFFDFPLEKGNHLIEISYCPKTFYFATFFSLISGIIIGSFFYIQKRKIENK